MNPLCEVTFNLHSSNEIKRVGFRGNASVYINQKYHLENFQTYSNINYAEITPIEKKDKVQDKTKGHQIESYLLSISLKPDYDETEVHSFIKAFAGFLSFFISNETPDPWYGTHFVEIEWHTLRIVSSDKIGVSDSLGISANQRIDLNSSDFENIFGNELVKFFYEGLKAKQLKSKYFHWFLIFEALENCPKYQSTFIDHLFSPEDEAQIKTLAESMNSSVKKGAVIALLKRTAESRKIKLFKLLQILGVSHYDDLEEEKPITQDIISNIIDGRNSLFHRGSSFPEGELWSLFRICRKILKLVIENPNILE